MRSGEAKTGPRAPHKHQDKRNFVFLRFLAASWAARGAQEAAQEAPKAPKRGPRPSKSEPGRLQEGPVVRPKRHSSEISKKPSFFHANPFRLRLQHGRQKSPKIDKSRPRKAKKSIKIAKLRA